MKKRLFVLCFILGLMCTACGNENISDDANIHIEETTQEGFDANKEVEKVEETEKSDETEKVEDGFNLFDELKDREFYFSSGAGGWRTVMHIDKDGSFSGEYSDSEMGSIGEGYPNGTYYVCSFQGKFKKPVKVNEYTYSVEIAGISYEKEPGTEEIIDDILYRYSEPYGIDGTNSLLFYLPGMPLNELPEGYLDWVQYEVEEAKDENLSFYGMYNEKEETGFSSYEVLNRIGELMVQTRDVADDIKASLENDPLTQQDMNEKSKELYDVWDTALNTIWSELKNTLPEDEFQTLLNEQRTWITEKESAVEKAAADVAGGSMEPLVRNMTAADMTEKRVYELYELLK